MTSFIYQNHGSDKSHADCCFWPSSPGGGEQCASLKIKCIACPSGGNGVAPPGSTEPGVDQSICQFLNNNWFSNQASICSPSAIVSGDFVQIYFPTNTGYCSGSPFVAGISHASDFTCCGTDLCNAPVVPAPSTTPAITTPSPFPSQSCLQPSKVIESITGIHQGPINCMTSIGGLLLTGSSDCSARAFNDDKLICTFK